MYFSEKSHFPIYNYKIKLLKKGKWTRRPLQILNILSKTNLSKNHNSISFSGRVHLPTVPHLQKSLHFHLRLILLILGVILGTGCACLVIHCCFKLHFQIINIQNTASVYTTCIHYQSSINHYQLLKTHRHFSHKPIN